MRTTIYSQRVRWESGARRASNDREEYKNLADDVHPKLDARNRIAGASLPGCGRQSSGKGPPIPPARWKAGRRSEESIQPRQVVRPPFPGPYRLDSLVQTQNVVRWRYDDCDPVSQHMIRSGYGAIALTIFGAYTIWRSEARCV